jgi:F0F1-type ATP synthase assembly protein I
MTDEGPEKRESEPTEEEVFERVKKLLGDDDFAEIEKALETPTDELSPEQKRMLELYEGLGESVDAQRTEAAKVHDEFESKLSALDEKIDRMRSARQKEERQVESSRVTDRADARGLGVGLSIAYAIIGLPLLGAGLGYLADRATDSNVWSGLGAVAGAVVGIVHAILMLNKHNPDK